MGEKSAPKRHYMDAYKTEAVRLAQLAGRSTLSRSPTRRASGHAEQLDAPAAPSGDSVRRWRYVNNAGEASSKRDGSRAHALA